MQVEQVEILSFWRLAAAIAVPLVIHIGLMIWWMSKISTKQDNLTTTVIKHIEEDDRVQQETRERLQALEVNEANIGGEIVNLGTKIDSLHREIAAREIDNGKVLQLKLDKQSSDLIVKFRDMLHESKKEWSAEVSRLAESIMRGRRT